MKTKVMAIGLVTLVLVACSSQPAVRVSDAEGIPSVSAIGMSCKKPFALTQDCSNWSGPTKKISLGGQEVKVAGNAEGTVTVMFGPNSSKATPRTNLGFDLLKRELVGKGFEITKVTPIESAGVMFGYAIETTEPNYQIWDAFKVE
ncbi:MAG: hypothetical protein KDI24_00010 [Pseudomonadales bacterium]|nr:hypothetical protein [Pseudomonadales bacterium]